jgi:peptidoglycan/xylan/chitin deacetylase (PgdA/CDA1 family)
MFKHTIPSILPLILHSLTWKVKTKDNDVFLTFDDGPHPEITPWVLQELKKYDAKATFFCIGHNIEKYPNTYQQILALGHSVGNHTYNHLNGWRHSQKDYFNNIEACAKVVKSNLFRPPYGRIVPWQIAKLKAKGYNIVMWNILTCDYDKNVDAAKAIATSVNATKAGSIIVFHDSAKAEAQLKKILPEVLQQLSQNGFQFKALS